jgi:hypothetical protein
MFEHQYAMLQSRPDANANYENEKKNRVHPELASLTEHQTAKQPPGKPQVMPIANQTRDQTRIYHINAENFNSEQ